MKYFTKREDRINILLTVLLLIIVFANLVQIYNYKAGERFEWSAGVLSQEGNVIQVRTCFFHHSGNWNYDVDKSRIIDEGWNEINYSEQSKDNAFYPDSLSITWFSFTEKKFYDGNFKLPYSSILEKAEKLRTTTNQYEETFARQNPNKILLNFFAEVLPKGKVIVWISDGDKKFKIGQYSAKPINETWHIFDDIEENDRNKKIDIATKVALVMEQHKYNIDLTLSDGFHLKKAEVKLFNQNDWNLKNSDDQKAYVFDHIPSGMFLSWGNDKKNYASQISLKELETLDAFRKLDVSDNSKPMMLELTVNSKNDSIHIVLKNGEKMIKIIPSYVDVYTLAN